MNWREKKLHGVVADVATFDHETFSLLLRNSLIQLRSSVTRNNPNGMLSLVLLKRLPQRQWWPASCCWLCFIAVQINWEMNLAIESLQPVTNSVCHSFYELRMLIWKRWLRMMRTYLCEKTNKCGRQKTKIATLFEWISKKWVLCVY